MYVTFFPESGVCTTVSRFPLSVTRFPLVDPLPPTGNSFIQEKEKSEEEEK